MSEHILQQRGGVASGLSSWPQNPPPFAYQEARHGARGNELCDCVVNPSHCFRSVSQRSLNVPTTFASALTGIPEITAGTLFFPVLFAGTEGCLAGVVPNAPGLIFNDANVQEDRQRINELVLYAIRSEVVVLLMDDEVVGAGSIDVSNLQQRIEDVAYQYVGLKIYHGADRNDPWIDTTNIGYFHRPPGEFLRIPPLKWVDRDPAMELNIVPTTFRGGARETAGLPFSGPAMESTRSLNGQAAILIECLFAPDFDVCPDIWTGVLCPPNEIGNTPHYTGAIETARR